MDNAVLSWTFASPSLKYILRGVNPNKKENVKFSDMTGFKEVNTNLHAIQPNFLDTVNLKYYLPTELQDDIIKEYKEKGEPIKMLENGQIDPIQFIFSDYALEENQEEKDPYNLSIDNFPDQSQSQYMKQIKVIIPEGYRDVLSLDTTRAARLCLNNCKSAYKVTIRGMATKIPGWFFTGY